MQVITKQLMTALFYSSVGQLLSYFVYKFKVPVSAPANAKIYLKLLGLGECIEYEFTPNSFYISLENTKCCINNLAGEKYLKFFTLNWKV